MNPFRSAFKNRINEKFISLVTIYCNFAIKSEFFRGRLLLLLLPLLF